MNKGSFHGGKMGKVGLLDQLADPPPRKLVHLKVNFLCLFCISDYPEHFNFS